MGLWGSVGRVAERRVGPGRGRVACFLLSNVDLAGQTLVVWLGWAGLLVVLMCSCRDALRVLSVSRRPRFLLSFQSPALVLLLCSCECRQHVHLCSGCRLNFDFHLASSAIAVSRYLSSSRFCPALSPLPFPLEIACAVHTGCSHVVCVVELLFIRTAPSNNTGPIFNHLCLKILTTTLSPSLSLPAPLPSLALSLFPAPPLHKKRLCAVRGWARCDCVFSGHVFADAEFPNREITFGSAGCLLYAVIIYLSTQESVVTICRRICGRFFYMYSR